MPHHDGLGQSQRPGRDDLHVRVAPPFPASHRRLWPWAVASFVIVSLAGWAIVAVVYGLSWRGAPDHAPPPLPPIRLTAHEVFSGDDMEDDNALAGQKFDAKYKGRTLEIYGVVISVLRHPGNKVTVKFLFGLGQAYRVNETTPLHRDMKILIRTYCRGWQASPTFTDAELVTLPTDHPDSPESWFRRNPLPER